MKKNILNTIKLAIIAFCVIPVAASAQKEFYGKPSYWRPKDKTGIHMFETPKTADNIPFEGPRVLVLVSRNSSRT